MTPASATTRNGTGANPDVYTSPALPVIGTVWTAEVDASRHPGAGFTFLVMYDAPLSGVPTGIGELLVDVGSFHHLTSVAHSGGGVAAHDVAVPNDTSFVGAQVSTQAAIVGGGYAELTNAIDLVIGC